MKSYEWDFFIAHAGADFEIAESLYDLMSSSAKVFLDRRNILLGDDWDRALPIAQKSSLITIVLISLKTDQAYYQREEIAAAIAFARENPENHRVVPIYLDDASAASDNVPYGLRLKHGIILSDDKPINEVAEELLNLLQQLSKKKLG